MITGTRNRILLCLLIAIFGYFVVRSMHTDNTQSKTIVAEESVEGFKAYAHGGLSSREYFLSGPADSTVQICFTASNYCAEVVQRDSAFTGPATLISADRFWLYSPAPNRVVIYILEVLYVAFSVAIIVFIIKIERLARRN